MRGEHVPVSERVAELPDRMALAVEAALRVDPPERPPDAVALLEAWTGTAGAAHVTWDPDLLGTASALASRPPPETGSGATVDLDALPAAVEEAPTPRRYRPLRAASAGIAILLALLAAWALVPRPAPDHFTASSAPAMADEDDAAALNRAWTALLHADVVGAKREAQALTEARPDAIEAALVLHAALRAQNRGAEAEEVLSTRSLGLDVRDGDRAALARAASTSYDRGVLAWASAHPEDVLGQLLVAQGVATDWDERLAHTSAFREAHPQLAIAWMLEARSLQLHGRHDEAMAALDRAAALAPTATWLVYERGRLLAAEERWEEAEDALLQAIERDPALWSAHARLATLRLGLGDYEGSAREAEVLRQPGVPSEDRLSFALEYAFLLLGHGRVSEALDLTREAAALAESERRWGALGRIALVEFTIHDLANPYTPSHREAAERLRAIAALPGMPDRFRQHLQTSALAVEAERAVLDGDIARGRTVAAQLREMGAPQAASRVDSSVRVAEGEPVPTEGACLAVCTITHTQEAMGQLDAANRAWAALDFDTCDLEGVYRMCAAEGHVRQGEVALGAGDAQVAREHAAAARALWPAPDPEAAMPRRLATLEDALAERR